MVEYDYLTHESGLVYGIEETKSRKCSTYLEKAVQAIAGSILFPWIPYRVDSSLVSRTESCDQLVKGAVSLVPPPNGNLRSCADARILDAFYGELAMLAKLSAVAPGEGSLLTRITRAASNNTSKLLDDSKWREIYDLISGFRENVAFNLQKISEHIARLQVDKPENENLERFIARISEAAEHHDYIEEFNSRCTGVSLILLAPRLYVTHSLKETARSLFDTIKNYGLNIERILLMGYDLHVINYLKEETSNIMKYVEIKTSKLASPYTTRQLKEAVSKFIGTCSRCILVNTLLDFGKDDLRALIEVLEDKLKQKMVDSYLLSWTLYRIKYKYLEKDRQEKTSTEARFWTRPTVAFYSIKP